MTSLDTKVEGTPRAVTGAADWLRDTLATKLGDAGEDQQDARNDSRGSWDGEAGSSYRNVAGDVLTATDKHEERVKRAATALDQYAARLQRCIDDMGAIRGRASSGGLTVSGTVIHQPPDAPATSVEAGSPEEAAHRAAVARIELWNEIVDDTAKTYQDFTDWVDSQMPPDVADARQKDSTDSLLDIAKGAFPNAASGAGAGLAGMALMDKANDLRAEAREFRRRSRRSGNPRVRGQADRPAGKAHLDDLLGKASWLKKGGRFFGGPAGIALDAGFGIYEGHTSGDWTRAALTTGSSIAVGVGVTALVAAGVITAPVSVVVIGGALAAGAVSAGVGYVYDNWDDITDDVGDAWDSATDTIGDAWDSVTPW